MPDRLKGKSGIFKVEDAGNAQVIVIDTDDFTLTDDVEVSTFNVHGQDGAQAEDDSSSYNWSLSGLLSNTNAGQQVIKKGALVKWWFYTDKDNTGATDPSYSGEAKVSSIERGMPADGKSTFSVSGTGNGEIVLTGGVW